MYIIKKLHCTTKTVYSFILEVLKTMLYIQKETIVVYFFLFISQIYCHGQQCCTSCDNFHQLNHQINTMLGQKDFDLEIQNKFLF